MKRVARLLGFLGVVCLLSSCGGRSFITDASYRQRVEQDFNQKKERLPQGDLFAAFVFLVYEIICIKKKLNIVSVPQIASEDTVCKVFRRLMLVVASR